MTAVSAGRSSTVGVMTTCPAAREAVAAGVAARDGDQEPLRRFTEMYGHYVDGWVCPECGDVCDAFSVATGSAV